MIRVLYVILLLMVMSCNAQNNDVELSASVTVIPSGGGEYGYSLIVEGNEYRMVKKELDIKDDKVILKGDLSSNEKSLQPKEIDSLQVLTDKLSQVDFSSLDEGFVLDVWEFDIYVSGKYIGKTNSSKIMEQSTPKIVREFIQYLLSIAPDKIKLEGFS